jgi:hypothetical protein
MEQAAVSLPDADAITTPELFPRWQSGIAYVIGDRICYEEILYKCVQAHTSQDDWTPDATPALWTIVSVEEWPEWRQPTGAQDAYMNGDKVSHNGQHWISTADNNVWEPGVYGWKQA